MCPISLGVAAVGLGASVYGAFQGQAAQKEAMQAQQRMDNLKAARERTQQIRESRARRGDIEQRAANQGAGQSSSAQSGAAGVTSEAYGNIEYIGFEQQTGEAMSAAKQKELNAEGVSSLGQGLTELGGTLAQPQNQKEIESIFS